MTRYVRLRLADPELTRVPVFFEHGNRQSSTRFVSVTSSGFQLLESILIFVALDVEVLEGGEGATGQNTVTCQPL